MAEAPNGAYLSYGCYVSRIRVQRRSKRALGRGGNARAALAEVRDYLAPGWLLTLTGESLLPEQVTMTGVRFGRVWLMNGGHHAQVPDAQIPDAQVPGAQVPEMPRGLQATG